MVMPMGIEGTSSRLEFSSVQKKRECIALPLFNVLGKSQLLEALIKYDRLLAGRRFGHNATDPRQANSLSYLIRACYCLFCEIRFIRSSLLSLRSLYPRSS